MFGRTVSGPLQLVKSAWLQETDLSTAKQNVVEFILNTRERLRHALDLAVKQTLLTAADLRRYGQTLAEMD